MPQPDLVLLHPPSVYDFRQRSILYGPISDLIPSSPVFEMYPLGFLTMTHYLETRGFQVRVINLALRMMNDRHLDVRRLLAKLRPLAFGIDLHWLPHAHGSLELAGLLKQIHPDLPTIFGGLSATYYHRELIDYPQVDYVLRGDSVEPPLHGLMASLREGRQPESVGNLTWKDASGVRVNPKQFVPHTLDRMDLRPDRMVKMVLRYRDLQSVLPFNGWWSNPITAVFTVKGCAHECVTCGGSKTACGLLSARQNPVFRSPESVLRNMLDIAQLSRGPIFLVGDLRQAGADYADRLLDLLSRQRIRNQIVFELFDMPPLEYLQRIDVSVRNWSVELSPESHDPKVRAAQDRTASYSNHDIERVVREASRLRCQRIDVFFMIGLPHQTRQSVLETVRYCEHLFQISDSRLSCFISPLGPFLDPGSAAFENPQNLGYRTFARTLAEHRELLTSPSWEQMLNYETRWMSRRELVDATYDAAEQLNRLKLKYGRIKSRDGAAVEQRIAQARALKARLESIDDDGAAAQAQLRGEVQAYSVSTVCDKRELFWRRHLINFNPWTILRIGISYLLEQLGLRGEAAA